MFNQLKLSYSTIVFYYTPAPEKKYIKIQQLTEYQSPEHHTDAPFLHNGIVDVASLEAQERQTTSTSKKIMSHCWLKSPWPGLLPVEDNEQCSTAKYRAKFPSIGSHSPERKQTRGGLGGWRHSRHK